MSIAYDAVSFSSFTNEIHRLLGVEVELLEAESGSYPKWQFYDNAGRTLKLDRTETAYPPLRNWNAPFSNAREFAAALNEWAVDDAPIWHGTRNGISQGLYDFKEITELHALAFVNSGFRESYARKIAEAYGTDVPDNF